MSEASTAGGARRRSPGRDLTRADWALLALTSLLGTGALALVFWPGLMSFDSLLFYEQALTGVRHSTWPPMYTYLIELVRAAGGDYGALFLGSAFAVLFAGGLVVLRLSEGPLVRRAAALFVYDGLFILFPTLAGTMAVLWNVVPMAGATLIAVALHLEAVRRRRLAFALAAAVFYAVCFALRYNAMLMLLPGLVLLILFPVGRQSGSRRQVGAALVLLAALVLASASFSYRLPDGKKLGPNNGVTTIQVFDLFGISACAGEDYVSRAEVGAPVTVADIRGHYDPRHVNIVLAEKPGLGSVDRLFSPRRVAQAWSAAVVAHPGCYLVHHRWRVFREQLGVGGAQVFLPMHEGIDANRFGFRLARPELARQATGALMAGAHQPWRRPAWLYLGAAVALGVFAWRRDSRLAVAGAMAFGAFAFAGSHLVATPAADARYIFPSNVLCAVLIAAAVGAGRRPDADAEAEAKAPTPPLADGRPGRDAVVAYSLVLLGGLLAMLAANLPGHLSYDSVVQLYEGHFHVRVTWAPAIVSWVLGVFDAITPGTGLYLVASGLLLFASLASLAALRRRASWLAVGLAAALSLSPTLLIYQGIVWKDVLFANLAVAGFVLLAHAATAWERRGRRILLLAGAAVALASAMLVRQNGAVAAVVAALALGWVVAGRSGWKQAAAWSVAGLAVILALSQAIAAVAQPAPGGARDDARGLRVLQRYDIVGAAAHSPGLRLPLIEAADPVAGEMIRRQGVALYSPERVDTLSRDPGLGRRLKALPGGTVGAQWRDLLLHHPGAYLMHRADAFRWLVASPAPQRCLPLHVGVEGDAAMLRALRIQPGQDPRDRALAQYGYGFLHTPLFSHLAFGAVSALVAVLLMVRRDPADKVMAGLMVAALGFTASFFVISIACDYRYLYLLDLAAITGVLYLALDPRLRRAQAQ